MNEPGGCGRLAHKRYYLNAKRSKLKANRYIANFRTG